MTPQQQFRPGAPVLSNVLSFSGYTLVFKETTPQAGTHLHTEALLTSLCSTNLYRIKKTGCETTRTKCPNAQARPTQGLYARARYPRTGIISGGRRTSKSVRDGMLLGVDRTYLNLATNTQSGGSVC